MRDFSNLPTWLPRHMKRKHFSAEQLGHHVGVSRTSIYRYLYDMDRPTEETMAKICRVLGVPLEEGLRQYVPKKAGNPHNRRKTVYTRGRKTNKVKGSG